LEVCQSIHGSLQSRSAVRPNIVCGDKKMNTDTIADAKSTNAPSADFVRAVSDLLDTDPVDLLTELGYYDRSRRASAPLSPPSRVPVASR
jgi:hypothetical protein